MDKPARSRRYGLGFRLRATTGDLWANIRDTFYIYRKRPLGMVSFGWIFFVQYPPVVLCRYGRVLLLPPCNRVKSRFFRLLTKRGPAMLSSIQRLAPLEKLSPVDQALVRSVRRCESHNVSILLERGANAGLILQGHVHLVSHAVYRNDLETVRLLLAAGANVNGHGGGFSPLLMVAAVRHLPEMVQLLLDQGAGVDGTGPMGMTALRYAAAKGYADICQILLRYGADPWKRDMNGSCAIECAKRHGFTEIVEMIANRQPMPGRRSVPVQQL